jgi:hypothetical protein
MLRSRTLALLATGAALLAVPAGAHASWDLTISDAPTTGVTVDTTSTVAMYHPNASGANLDVAELEAMMAAKSQITIDPPDSGGGAEPGDITISAPIDGPSDLYLSPPTNATIHLDAGITARKLSLGGAAVVVGQDVVLASTDPAATDRRVTGTGLLRLEGDLRVTTPAAFTGGARGPHAVRLDAPNTAIGGTWGPSGDRLAALSATDPLTINGTVRTTGAVALPGGIVDDGAGSVAIDAGTVATLGPVDTGTLTVTAPDVRLAGDVTTTGGNQTYNGPVTPTADATLAGAVVGLADALALGAHTVTVDAAIGATFGGPLRGTPAARLRLTGPGRYDLAAATPSDPVVVTAEGDSRANVLSAYDTSSFELRGGTLTGTGRGGPVTNPAGGVIDPGTRAGSTPEQGELRVGALALDASATVRLDAFATGTPFDRLVVDGPVALGGAALDLPAVASTALAPDATATLVDHRGDGPVSGTFAGLPEGAKVTVGGVALTLSYHGGDGNDVTLSRVRATPTLGVTAPVTSAAPGEPVTLTAMISPSTATGTVTFRAGDQTLGTAPLTGGVATLTTPAPAGRVRITVAYAGDDQVRPATSAAFAFGGVDPPAPPVAPAPIPPFTTPPVAPPVAPPTVGPPPAAPRDGLTTLVAGVKRVQRVQASAGRLAFRQTFAEAGRVTWRLAVRGAKVAIATRSARVRAGTASVALKIGARGRRALARAPKARLVLTTTLVDPTGAEVAVTVTLRRPAGLR